jgi:hypothetical protein
MSPSYWGPSTWVFMHTLAAKIKEDSFPLIGPKLIITLIQICNNLPCPDCAKHAKEFWSKVKVVNIKNKSDLVNLLFVFHNMVNKRRNVKGFKYENLKYYETKNVIETYNIFSRNFNTRGNMNLINESFHRNMMIASLKKWIMTNINHFDR